MKISLNVYISIFYTPYNFENILTFYELFTGIVSFPFFLFFFSMNNNKVLSVGPKSVKMLHKAPDILLQYQLKNIKNS